MKNNTTAQTSSIHKNGRIYFTFGPHGNKNNSTTDILTTNPITPAIKKINLCLENGMDKFLKFSNQLIQQNPDAI